jgi:DNA-binding transcriptional LysR family regulator
MDIREVRSFLMLAERLHFGHTARLLNLSQPALTKQIRRLEEDLGGSLLVRSRHGAQLTSLGRFFQGKVRDVVQDWDDLFAHTRRVARGEAGRLRLGFGMHTFELVPRAIVQFRKTLPELDFSLRDMSTVEQIDALLAEKIDLGFIRLCPVKNLSILPLTHDRLMLITNRAAGYPVTASVAAVRHEPFVLISRQRSRTLHQHALDLCSRYGFRPRIVQEAPEVTTVLALVKAGMGVSMIPQSFGINRFQGIRTHHLSDKSAAWTVAAAWRKGDPNPLIHKFLGLLKASLPSQVGKSKAHGK